MMDKPLTGKSGMQRCMSSGLGGGLASGADVLLSDCKIYTTKQHI